MGRILYIYTCHIKKINDHLKIWAKKIECGFELHYLQVLSILWTLVYGKFKTRVIFTSSHINYISWVPNYLVSSVWIIIVSLCYILYTSHTHLSLSTPNIGLWSLNESDMGTKSSVVKFSSEIATPWFENVNINFIH